MAKGAGCHLVSHVAEMTKLHKQGSYDRMTEDFLKLTDEMPTIMHDFVKSHAAIFTRRDVAA